MGSLLCVFIITTCAAQDIFTSFFSHVSAVSTVKSLYSFHTLPAMNQQPTFSLKSILALKWSNNPIAKEAVPFFFFFFYFQLKMSSSFDNFSELLWSGSEQRCCVPFRELDSNPATVVYSSEILGCSLDEDRTGKKKYSKNF